MLLVNVQRVPPEEEVRVWSTGCATGEEPYSLVILFLAAFEALDRPPNLKVFATDIHRGALSFAGTGICDSDGLAHVSEARRKRFFRRREDDKFQVSQELRSHIVFSRNNAIRDAPFTRLHLISCRNLLIYLQSHAQKKVISMFHFGLRASGLLLMWGSETPGDLKDEFETVDQKNRIYKKRRDIRLPADLRSPVSSNHGLQVSRQIAAAVSPSDLGMLGTYN